MAYSLSRQPSWRETAVSIGVLLALGAVSLWLWRVQRQFSPAVTVAVTAAQAAQAGAARTADTETALARAATADLLGAWPEGLRGMSPAETFTAETLSDKIDGKAELYLSANVVGMRCQRVAASATAWFEAFIYDMGTPENAFSVYSSQKRTATQEGGVGDYSYRAGNQLCLVHGRFYVECVGADDSAATLAGATALARAFVATTAVAQHANMARDESLFPIEGLVPGSLMRMSADVFGFDQLNNTYVARYQQGSDTVTLFLTRRANAAAAAQLAQATRGFFIDDCGGKEAAPPARPAGAVLIEADGSFDGVFARGEFVGGVHQAPNRAAAERWLQRLSEKLPGGPPAQR